MANAIWNGVISFGLLNIPVSLHDQPDVFREALLPGAGMVVIRTREYLCGLMPLDALVLVLLRFPQEIVSPDEFKVPGGKLADYRISGRRKAL